MIIPGANAKLSGKDIDEAAAIFTDADIVLAQFEVNICRSIM